MNEEAAANSIDINLYWVFGVILALAAFAFLFDQLLLWIERKGYLYYRKVERKGTSASNVLLPLQSIFEPEVEHLIDMRAGEVHEEHRAGDDKDKNERDLDDFAVDNTDT